MSLCSFPKYALDKKVWILAGAKRSKGEVTGTRVGCTDYMAVEEKKLPWHLRREHLRCLEV